MVCNAENEMAEVSKGNTPRQIYCVFPFNVAFPLQDKEYCVL
jgi:hypothetical protein